MDNIDKTLINIIKIGALIIIGFVLFKALSKML